MVEWVLVRRPPARGNRPSRRARRPTRRRLRCGVPPSVGGVPRRRGSPGGIGVAAPIVRCGGCVRLPGVQGSSAAPARCACRGPRRHTLAVPLQPRGHLVPDGFGGSVHQKLFGRCRNGLRGSVKNGPGSPNNPSQGVHQGGNYRLPVGRPKRTRRIRVGRRQGARLLGGNFPPAEVLPRPQGRVVRYPGRGKRRACRQSHG